MYLVLSCTHHPFCIHVLTRLFQSTLNFLRPGKIFFSGVFPGLRARINKYYLSNRRSTSKARLLGRSVCLPSFIMMTLIWIEVISKYRLSWWLIGKESACNTRGLGPGRYPREGNSYSLQHSCLGNPMDRGAWRAPWDRKELITTEQLTLSHFHIKIALSYESKLCKLILPMVNLP